LADIEKQTAPAGGLLNGGRKRSLPTRGEKGEGKERDPLSIGGGEGKSDHSTSDQEGNLHYSRKGRRGGIY